MADIDLDDVKNLVCHCGTTDLLIEAAATVANAIAVGAGGMIKGTLMESELRAALLLGRGQLVNVRRRPAARGDSNG